MKYHIQTRFSLSIVNEDGTLKEIVDVSRSETFDGSPKEFRDHFGMLGYEVDCRVEREFDKAFPEKPKEVVSLTAPPKVDDDEIPL